MNTGSRHYWHGQLVRGHRKPAHKNTVRFGQVIHPTRRPLREPTGLELVECLKASAAHYRELAKLTGRPAKHALFIQFAQEREKKAGDLEATIRGRQQPPGELFQGETQP